MSSFLNAFLIAFLVTFGSELITAVDNDDFLRPTIAVLNFQYPFYAYSSTSYFKLYKV